MNDPVDQDPLFEENLQRIGDGLQLVGPLELELELQVAAEVLLVARVPQEVDVVPGQLHVAHQKADWEQQDDQSAVH